MAELAKARGDATTARGDGTTARVHGPTARGDGPIARVDGPRVLVSLHAWNGEGTSGAAGGYLLFGIGARLDVLEEGEAGDWWWGRLDGKEGWFPSSFCTLDLVTARGDGLADAKPPAAAGRAQKSLAGRAQKAPDPVRLQQLSTPIDAAGTE